MVFDTAPLNYSSNYAYSLDSVHYYGVEAEFDTQVSDNLGIFGNYSYLKTEHSDPEYSMPVSFWLNLAPKHKFNLGVRWRLFQDTLLTADLRYVGKRENEAGYDIDGYITTDLSLRQALSDRVEIFTYVNNTFGENYEEIYGFPMPDQVFGIEVKVSLF